MPYDDGISDDIGGLDEQGLGLRRRGLLTPGQFQGVGTADFPPVSRAPQTTAGATDESAAIPPPPPVNPRYDSGRPRLPATFAPGLDAAEAEIAGQPGPQFPAPPPVQTTPPMVASPGQQAGPPPVKPPGYAERYAALQAEKPNRDDPRFAVPGWKEGLGFAAATLAGTFNPRVNAGELYHHVLAGPYEQALGDWSQREAAVKQEASLADTEAQMRQRDEAAELAKKKATEPAKRQFENIQQLHADAVQDAIGRGVDPSKDPKVLQIEDSMQRIQPEKAPQKQNDFEQFYKDYITDNHLPDSAHNRLMARQEYAKAGHVEPKDPGSYMPLYDEHGKIIGAWNAKSGAMRNAPNTPGTTAAGSHIATSAEAATEKKVAPLKAVIEEADKAATLKDMADKGNAEADVDLALTFFKSMRSSTSGGSGIRFTQQENNLIMGARNLWGGLEVKGNRLFSNGQPLSKVQRQQILDVINVHRQAAQRQLDEMKAGGGGGSPASPTATGNTPAATGGAQLPSFKEWKAKQGAGGKP